MDGYSDPINHAFAFAAKHHDQQVRKGTRLPYVIAAPNIAVILARYGRDDDTLIAGILHDVVEDSLREGITGELLERRLAEKFGDDVLADVLSVVERRYDDDGIELSAQERKDDLVERLSLASDRARWVAAAEQLQTLGRLLADLRRTDFPESVWGRFALGREGTLAWHRRFHEGLRTAGFDAPIMSELARMLQELAMVAEEDRARAERR